jgi:hypothetical protein
MFAGLMSRWRMPAARSGPVMEKLHAWLTAQLQEKKAERNPGLGQANSYLLNHWQELTLFLCQPGAPLDNNICERPLQKVILHRKNALFYKEPEWRSSRDLFMSLIHTCELSDTNPGLSDSVTAARLGAGRKSPRLDAMELLRYAGTHPPRCHVPDSLWKGGGVAVTSLSPSGWTFTADPSQHFLDGTVRFSATNAGNGNINLSITTQGNYTSYFWRHGVPLSMPARNPPGTTCLTMFGAIVSESLESLRKQSLGGKDERWCESNVA